MNTEPLKVKIAELAIVDLRIRWMIQITEPMLLIPEEHCLSYDDLFVTNSSDDMTQALNNSLLEKWKNIVKDLPDNHEWKAIDKVELIECDLMVPIT